MFIRDWMILFSLLFGGKEAYTVILASLPYCVLRTILFLTYDLNEAIGGTFNPYILLLYSGALKGSRIHR